ncbi:MAG: hypothetical protein P8Z00_06185 [Anaerolineales bacterium]|jgi:hypothetical protein
MKIKKLFSILAISLTFVLVFTSVAYGMATQTTDNVVVPINISFFVPCAAGGAGETVNLSCNLHELTEITENANGSYHMVILHQPQGVSGYGQTTGYTYQGAGATLTETDISGLPFQDTYANNFLIIGQRSGNNFRVHDTIHDTINAQGEVTAEVDDVSITCK